MRFIYMGGWLFFALGMIHAVDEDIRLRIIPDIAYITLLAGAVFALWRMPLQTIAARIGFALLLGAALLFVAALSGQLGGGDVKLVACMALYFEPLPNLYALFFSCLFGLIFCAVFWAVKKAKLKSLAFAPFLCVGYSLILILNFWR